MNDLVPDSPLGKALPSPNHERGNRKLDSIIVHYTGIKH